MSSADPKRESPSSRGASAHLSILYTNPPGGVSAPVSGGAIGVFQWRAKEEKWALAGMIGALENLEINAKDKLRQPGLYEGQRILVRIQMTPEKSGKKSPPGQA